METRWRIGTILTKKRGRYLSRNVIILLATNTIKNDGDKGTQKLYALII